MMSHVIITPAQHRPDAESDGAPLWADQRPSHNNEVSSRHAEDFTLNDDPAAVESPSRPRRRRESRARKKPGRMYGAWIKIRRKRDQPAVKIDPLIEMIHQRKPISRRFARNQQQRVVAPCIRAGYGTRRKPAPPVGFKPFQAQGAIEILAIPTLYLHLRPPIFGGADRWFLVRASFSPAHPWARRDAPFPTKAPP